MRCDATRWDKVISQRIGIASGVARSLEKIWKAKDISKETKVVIYRSLVQSILLHNAETWTLKMENIRSLRVFEMSVSRKILGRSKRDHRHNTDILNKLFIKENIVEILRTRRLSYFGHVAKMNPNR